jgi:hypothetical protein
LPAHTAWQIQCVHVKTKKCCRRSRMVGHFLSPFSRPYTVEDRTKHKRLKSSLVIFVTGTVNSLFNKRAWCWPQHLCFQPHTVEGRTKHNCLKSSLVIFVTGTVNSLSNKMPSCSS